MNIPVFLLAMIVYGLLVLWLTLFFKKARLDILAMVGIVFVTVSFIYLLIRGVI